MSILVDKNTRVLTQGITGATGQFHTRACREYGTQMVGGVVPGKGGTDFEGIPIFDTVEQARKKTGANVMLNPGVYPDQSYLNISVPSTSMLIVNVFEDSYANYLNATVPSWAFSYPAIKMSHLVYSATAAQMPNAVSLSSQRNVGWVFVTDLGVSNPWAALPSYWSSLTALVKSGC